MDIRPHKHRLPVARVFFDFDEKERKGPLEVAGVVVAFFL
jgi:hypothetical protein